MVREEAGASTYHFCWMKPVLYSDLTSAGAGCARPGRNSSIELGN